ncbi:fucose-binding lectin II [Streptomyces sp. NPDC004266]
MQPSKLNCGGPYDIGTYNLMVVVAENGDDGDYNDSILELSRHTSKA